jgi:RNA polymerase sigma-70 factor, ECF subfamily
MDLFLKVQPQIYGYLRTMVLNRADAEDVLQDVARVLWQKFDQFEPGTRFDQWAYKIAYHQALCFMQKQRRAKLRFNSETLTLIADTCAAMNDEFDEVRDALEACMERLLEPDREIVRLRFEPAATNRSVAASLGRSETAVSRALNRIYTVLLDCIQRRTAPGKQGDER